MAFVDTWLARRVLAVIALGLLAIALAWAEVDAAFADIGGAPPSIDAAHATAVATTAKLSAADQARKQVFDERRQRLQSRKRTNATLSALHMSMRRRLEPPWRRSVSKQS